ncbi:mannose-ethanolamine phosphotransferase gpi13 [Coemansia brasiliensis]|uniref:Mannose-ethanolamine phosphotransferase gpi13 n=1 Tax=Coemansia brasiliensis TaxID=2650707 RepID=A0A9W8IBE5_9FUNG|nr:mannose-ethanolamine phosphotransferase gpi13 [Coemansia brasiliensis]
MSTHLRTELGAGQVASTLRVRAHWVVSLLLVSLSAAGFWLFARGFLLTRMVLPDQSLPEVLPFSDPAVNGSASITAAECEWYPAKFERTIILVIDAMRVDFATWSDELNSTFGGVASKAAADKHQLKPYHNRLPAIAALSRARPDQSMLYRFRADPPTTTLQRLKGLTTGQLPTFIDAGSSFSSSAIDEDNWLKALRRSPPSGCGSMNRSRNVVFLGDDTWVGLFPDDLSDTQAAEVNGTEYGTSWARVRPFPSFNVWDLDTVDDGLLSRLPMFLLPPESKDQPQELHEERNRWKALVKQPHMWDHADFGNASQANSMTSDKVGPTQLYNDWDVIIAHGLGVDHCGHRFGPDHSAISHKLTQMNQAIELIVSAIDRDKRPTALYVFGDHGMDPKGDHGGDSPREVDAGLWIYSNKKWRSKKGNERVNRVLDNAKKLSMSLSNLPDEDLREGWWQNTHLRDDYKSAQGDYLLKAPQMRSVSQIDLVSTLSLSLGLPIPFNNLGTVIPEMFAADDNTRTEWGLLYALRLNAAQILRYIEKYVNSSRSHGFADDALRLWRIMYERAEVGYRELVSSKNLSLEEKVAAEYLVFTRLVLSSLRQMWAQFDLMLILAGLLTLLLSIAALVILYIQTRQKSLDDILACCTWTCISGGIASAVLSRALVPVFALHWTTFEATVAGLAVGTAAALCIALVFGKGLEELPAIVLAITPASALNTAAIISGIIHLLAFSSNSFTFNEDRVVLYTVQTLAVVAAAVALRSLAPSISSIKRAGAIRALVCMSAILVINRGISYSTVCREEQLPGCKPTFYGAPSASISTVSLAVANMLMVWLVPSAVSYALRRSHSDRAMVARLWVSIGMRVSMGMAAVYWVLDSIDSQAKGLASAPGDVANWSDLRMVLARMAAGIALGGGLAAWYASPFCIDIKIPDMPIASGKSNNMGARKTAIILGYGNAYGAAYLVFVTVVFCVLYLLQQPMGGIMLSLLFIELLLSAEAFDALKDALEVRASSLLPAQVVVTGLLSYMGYFATGHQFTLVSIQWSTAFVGVREMQLVLCGAIVALNTLGAFILAAVCMPLSTLWNESLGSQVLRLAPNNYFSQVTGAGAAYMAYHMAISTSSAVCAAWFRRHLMVWKIFAPRFMFSIPVALVSGAIVLFVAVGLGVVHILRLGLDVNVH